MSAPKKILELNAFDMTRTEALDSRSADLVARRQRTFGPTSMLFYKQPLNLVRGEGVWLYAADGRRYLDAYNNVPSCGHCHPRIVAAVAAQMGQLNTHTRYLYDIVYTYAERLLATYPADVSNVVFTCTGSESVDLALRIARTVTGGSGIIATENAYHGNTSLVTEVSPSSASAAPRSPTVFLVPAPDTYRLGLEAACRQFTEGVGNALRQMNAQGIKPAAMIADSILSSDGVYPGSSGFLADAVERVHQAGALYIADEVQPGFGRTGEAMWGFQRHGIVPDLAVMGKPMGNGYPIGGVAAKPALLAAFGSGSGYFNTFGGSPVASAAGLAVLDVIKDEGLQDNARDTGAYLLEGLREAASRHDCAGDVRGAGLYVGFEFVGSKEARDPDQAAATFAVNALRERGILVGTAGLHGNILKIRPPLCFTREHADKLIEGMRSVLSEMDRPAA